MSRGMWEEMEDKTDEAKMIEIEEERIFKNEKVQREKGKI